MASSITGSVHTDGSRQAPTSALRRAGARVALLGLLATAVVALAPTQQPAGAAAPVGVHGNRIVSESAPVTWTPHVDDGYVQAIAEVGNTVIIGGNFSTVQNPARTQTYTRNHIFAFQKGTGVISQTFVPQLNGEVMSIVPTGDGETVWVAGGFSTVNGQPRRNITKLNVVTGEPVTTFQPPLFNGRVHDIILRGDRLYVTGRFTMINNQPHTLVAALNPVTGALLPDVKIDIAVPRPERPGGALTIMAADVTPDGSKMIVIGNFTVIAGQPRYQIGMIDLTTSPISVADWRTNEYDDPCTSSVYTYMRDVEFSPDGSFFVVVTTGAFGGGYAARTLCDASARWETAATGTGLQPTWVNYAGGDSLFSVAISDSVVYQGGHERRINNPYGSDRPGRGSVWVEGISAIDPRGGGTFSWDPGRDRGHGVETLEVTADGLWVGSDTTRIARHLYRGRLAMFPLSSGWDLPNDYTGSLPGTVYSLGRDAGTQQQQHQLVARQFDGGPVTESTTIATDVALGNIRGAFMVDGKLYSAWEQNGTRTFRVQSFDGQSFGPPETIDLRLLDGDNPSGCPGYPNDNVAPGTSSCNQVNTITPPNAPNFGNFDIPNSRGMFYDPVTGRLYFNSPQYTWSSSGTRTSPPNLAYRQFSTESNIVGAVRYETVGNMAGLDWTQVRSMFLVGSDLYIANTAGTLTRWTFDHLRGAPVAGTGVVVSGPGIDGQDWRARDAFVYVGEGATPPNKLPSAVASVLCDDHGLCLLDGSGSSDADGSIVSYAWDFGDGTDTVVTTEPIVTHVYLADGDYEATLTVTDDDGGLGSTPIEISVAIANVAPSAVVSAAGSGFEFVFDGSDSTDPDGTIESYTWDFGDGTDSVVTTDPTVWHSYATPGEYTATLTVTDDDGATGTAQATVVAFDPDATPLVGFAAVASTNSNSAAPTVTVPATVQAGDLMVLIGSFNIHDVTITDPAGWTLLDRAANSTATAQTAAWVRTATAADAGTVVRVPLSAITKTSLQLASYRNVTTTDPLSVGPYAVDIDVTPATARTTPTVTVPAAGSMVISYWADKSVDSNGWDLPGTVTPRDQSVGAGQGRITAALTDTGPLAAGPAGGHTATSQSSTANRRGITWTITIQAAI